MEPQYTGKPQQKHRVCVEKSMYIPTGMSVTDYCDKRFCGILRVQEMRYSDVVVQGRRTML